MNVDSILRIRGPPEFTLAHFKVKEIGEPTKMGFKNLTKGEMTMQWDSEILLESTAFLQIKGSDTPWDHRMQRCPPRHAPLPIFLLESGSEAEDKDEILMGDLCWPIGNLRFPEDRTSDQEKKGLPVFGSRVLLNEFLMLLHSAQVIKGKDEFCIQVILSDKLDHPQCRAMCICDIFSYEVGTERYRAFDDPLPDAPADEDAFEREGYKVNHLPQTLLVCKIILLDQVPFFDYSQFRALNYNRYEENLLLYRESIDKKDQGDQRPDPPLCDRSDSQAL